MIDLQSQENPVMAVTFLNRSFFQRLFGIPATPQPRVPGCWSRAGETIVIDLDKAPELDRPSGALRLEGGGLPIRVLVVHGQDGKYHAFHNRCTHLGHRRLDPVPGTATVQCCSVNKSTYAYDGPTLFGPAPRPITVFPVEREGGRLVVRLGR
jgi:nitrite reductase/ring-hydroxylating ferredoxin subunit